MPDVPSRSHWLTEFERHCYWSPERVRSFPYRTRTNMRAALGNPLRDLRGRLRAPSLCLARKSLGAPARLICRDSAPTVDRFRVRVGPAKWTRHHGSHGDHARLPIGASPEERRSSNLVVGVGLVADTAMTVAKAAIGAWSGSPALLSDAVHGASDMLVSIAVLATRWVPTGMGAM